MREGTVVVKVNGIEVGAMPLEQYEEIVRSVKKDWRIRVYTVANSFGIYLKLARNLFLTFIRCLGVITALFMIMSLFRPDAEIAAFIREIKSATPEGMAYAFKQITVMCIALTVMYYMFRMIYCGVPKYNSPSKIAIGNRLREVMEVPTKGEVSVIFIKDGAYCVR
ncbi:hypothetical protein D2K34_22845 [Salmonella enterica subsp. enterica serovar Ohio]|jgi:hypothetical protein|nr:hypothetical protein [Salmonella enterica subsp. enterica serovar Ohio]EJO7967819.1 hypothetical protein [Salmonella enterica]